MRGWASMLLMLTIPHQFSPSQPTPSIHSFPLPHLFPFPSNTQTPTISSS